MNAQALADTVEHMPAGGRGILDRALKLDAVKRCCTLRFVLMLVLVLCLAWSNGPRAQEVFAPSDELQRISARFIQEVTPQLAVSAQVLGDYTVLLEELLANEGVPVTEPQFLLLVDRSARVQAALLLWGAAGRGWHLVGAVPVSTGLPGKFEHFVTPLGVFAHSTENPDFRAEGTRNKLGFRGYGSKGMRIYDLGWVSARRGWGDGAMGVLRLQMHSTDPLLAAGRLGTPQSEGCIRIPATFNTFIDLNGLLDADYDVALPDGARRWVLDPQRRAVAGAGRSVVVVDSGATTRPVWSPAPGQRH